MQYTVFRHDSNFRCKKFVVFLAFFWIFSFVAGVLFATYFHNIPLSLMRIVVVGHVSIVGLVVILLLPFVLSVVAMRLSMPWIIYMIAVLKGFCYGFSIYFLLISYFDSAWLVCSLVMFSVYCGQIPLFLFWTRYMNDTTDRWKRDALACLVLLTLIGCLDYFVISPFLITLMR